MNLAELKIKADRQSLRADQESMAQRVADLERLVAGLSKNTDYLYAHLTALETMSLGQRLRWLVRGVLPAPVRPPKA